MDFFTALYYILMVAIAIVGMVFSVLGYYMLKKHVAKTKKDQPKTPQKKD